MRSSAYAFWLAASMHCLLSWLLLGSSFAEAVPMPPNQKRLEDYSLASIFAPRATDLLPFLGQSEHRRVTRALVPLKPKPINPGDPINPAEPDAPAPLTPEGPKDSKSPPAAKPNNPPESVPGSAFEPHLGQAPKANAKPDPYGPIPTEAEITTLCSIPDNKAIFWSGTRDKVHTYKMQAGLTSDSQAFPEGYTWTFRGIDTPKNTEFSYRFSRVFAKTAKGEVRLMVPWETGPNPTRTFHTDEWPILKEGMATGRITKIIQVNPNNWAEERVYDPTTYGLTRRAEVDLSKIPWDVNLDALERAWKRAIKQGPKKLNKLN